MDRPIRSASVETPTRTLTRPSSRSHRLRGRADRLRATWLRAVGAVGVGLVAAALTVAGLSAHRSDPDDQGPAVAGADELDHRPEAESDASATVGAVADGVGPLAHDQRILALERSAIVLPVSVGSTVEVVGFLSSVTDVEAEVIATRAEVVGVTDQAVLVALGAEAAYRAGEIAAVGRVTILGREHPPG